MNNQKTTRGVNEIYRIWDTGFETQPAWKDPWRSIYFETMNNNKI